MRHGHDCWSSVPINAGLQRNGKSCRLRWINYLRPGLKRGPFSLEEAKTILALHQLLGNKWSQMVYHLPGRAENEIKNYWHSYLKKRVTKMAQATQHQHTNVQIQTLKSSSPSLESITQNSSFESFEQREGSLIDTDQSMQKHSFPKVLFAEWLSFDQFSGQNSGIVTDFKNNFDNLSQNLEDSLVQGTFRSEMNTRFNEVYVDDMLESMCKFEYEISESGLVDYFPGEFCMNYDNDMHA